MSSGFGRSRGGGSTSLFFRFLGFVLFDLPIELEFGSSGSVGSGGGFGIDFPLPLTGGSGGEGGEGSLAVRMGGECES